MNKDQKIIEAAIACCLKYNIPFVSYIFPGSKEPEFFANPSLNKIQVKNSRKFTIGLWNSPAGSDIELSEELDALSTLKWVSRLNRKWSEPSLLPETRSTEKTAYSERLNEIIGILKTRGGKMVWSRVKCGRLSENITVEAADRWVAIALKYFDINPDTFRFCYYTPQTGAWLGASPERLLSADFESGRFSTMSLAGTRPVTVNDDKNKPWDAKNLHEHDLVTMFIMSKLKEKGISAECGNLETRDLPGLQHLCNEISGNLGNHSPLEIIECLNPTPALAGYPVETAIGEINRFESHKRHCYGGYVMIEDNQRVDSFVNLRSLHFYDDCYCIYAGGGITEQSDPEQEWDETDVKMSVLRSIVEKG